VLKIPHDTMVELPVDHLGLAVLEDMIVFKTWNSRNYILEAQQNGGLPRGEPTLALAEAIAWLYARGLIAADPDQSSPHAMFVTRTGLRVVLEGPDAFYSTERLQRGVLHPLIEREARPQFLIGKYEQGVFAAMKAVEIRVRRLGSFDDDIVGVDLMNKAFGPGGPLVDDSAVKGERDGTRAMFAGAYAILRNPAGHREVNYDDVAEAAEAVQVASLLMRILDRVEQRTSN
jgi:uncharacterized protein (TIGR02391 family)